MTQRISEAEGVGSSFFDDCEDFEAMLEKAQINKKESLQRLSFLDLSMQGSWAFGVDDWKQTQLKLHHGKRRECTIFKSKQKPRSVL